MWKFVNKVLTGFRECFKNEAAFGLFVVIVMGLMTHTDHLGVTSIVRELSLSGASYTAMVHFFRAKSWVVEKITAAWIGAIKRSGCAIKEGERHIMAADGVKEGQEGKKMPGVKKLHQESENSSKGSYIFGHLFGGLGILAGNAAKTYSVLISCRLHDGISAISKWAGEKDESHVVKMIKDAAAAARLIGDSILLLDRLYLTVPMLKTLKSAGRGLLSVVTKAKSNATAYLDPPPYKGRGAYPKRGKSVKVWDYFDTAKFQTDEAVMYGKKEKVSYYSIDLLWGQKLYQKLRFVLTVIDGVKSVLVSTDLTIEPMRVVQLYCYRFRIECSFRELKQVIAGFAYRFWSKVMPKLNRYKSNAENQTNLENVTDPKKQQLIISTVNAINGYVQLSCIALGILQLVSLLHPNEIVGRFMRTKSNAVPSEATVADHMRKNIFSLLLFFPNLDITAIIKSRQNPPVDDGNRDSG